MTPKVRLHQLYILREQVNLLIAMEEGDVPSDASVSCSHPEEKRRQTNNMGELPAYLCLACGETVLGVA